MGDEMKVLELIQRLLSLSFDAGDLEVYLDKEYTIDDINDIVVIKDDRKGWIAIVTPDGKEWGEEAKSY